ncbi:MAG: DUF3943 domain-containing protein [Spirochaetales bacterium]|nr:DUF3943 domain-containing protein [Spirochaetales bacterium]
MKKVLILFFLLCSLFLSAETSSPPVSALTLGPLFLNTAVWFPQKVLGVEFAQVTWEDWADHLSHPWVWDNDEFSVNQIGHPYQGSLSYGFARGAGWDFPGSLTATMIGSVTWELFMENESPSLNDFITTTLGGASLGEMFYRLSVELQRSASESDYPIPATLLSWALSPGGNLSRLVYQREPDRSGSPLTLRLSLLGGGEIGGDGLFSQDDYGDLGVLSLEMEARYGQIDRAGKDPFDLFSLRCALGGGTDNFTAGFFSEGLLTGKQLYLKSQKDHLLGLFLHYDFVYNEVVNLSANSLGLGWIHREKEDSHRGGDSAVHLSFVPLGSSECVELKLQDLINGDPDEERRNYDLGIGANLKLSKEQHISPKVTLLFRGSAYLLNIFEEGVPNGGSAGYTFKALTEAGVTGKINENTTLLLSACYWYSMTEYDDLDDRSDSLYSLRLGFRYSLL